MFNCKVCFLSLIILAVFNYAHAQELQPNTTLNEFKNASLAMKATDPGDEPSTCNLTSKDLAAVDMAVVEEDCAVMEGTTSPPGSPFCTDCGCALNLLAYKSLNNTGALKNMPDANDDMLDACASWTFQQAIQQGAISPSAVAALKNCAPLDFVCGKASKRLNTSLITTNMTDKFSVLGGAISDAVEEAAAGALPAVGAAVTAQPPAAAKSWSTAQARMSVLTLIPAALVLLMLQ